MQMMWLRILDKGLPRVLLCRIAFSYSRLQRQMAITVMEGCVKSPDAHVHAEEYRRQLFPTGQFVMAVPQCSSRFHDTIFIRDN